MQFHSLSAEESVGLTNFMILYVDRPFLKWKDSVFPPSKETLNKRVANYAGLYTSGYETGIPIIMDAINKGADPNQQVVRRENGQKVGTEPLIVKAARADKFFLVQALQSGGADLNAKDSYGSSALAVSSRRGSLEISSFLVEFGAELKQADADIAEASGKSAVAKYLKDAIARRFNASSGLAAKVHIATTPGAAATAKPEPLGN